MTTPQVCFQLRDVKRINSESFTLHVHSLDIARGEVFGLLGPTGSGKTTLLRLLSGLDPPTSGRLSMDGTSFDDRPPLAVTRRIASIHQRPALLDGSVSYNVEFGLRIRSAINRSLVQTVLEQLGLERIAKQDARTLSGGQAQLVAVARALVIEPDVLLLDEPTAHLDPAHVALVERAVVAASQRREMTIVWATHNLFQARRLAARVGLLLAGKLVEVAMNPAFFENPTDERTAHFVQGKMVY